MKIRKQRKHILFFIAVVTISVIIGNLCIGQAGYNNPDIISNTQREQIEDSLELHNDTKIVFAQIEQAREHLTIKDNYVESMTAFDIKIRSSGQGQLSREQYLNYISQQALQWTESEKNLIKPVIENISNLLKDYNMDFPDRILLIKTTGKEDVGAAYCRQNAIIIPSILLVRIGSNLENLIIHELFHVYTNHNPQRRAALYDIINFKECENVELPPELLEIEVTNPDVPKERYYVELLHSGRNIKVVPVISLPNFDTNTEGTFFRYLKLNLVAIEEVDEKWRFIRNSNEEPVIFETQDVPGYFNKIGENTSYVIHPEEILADNFVLMVQARQSVKSRWIIDKLRELIQKENPKQISNN